MTRAKAYRFFTLPAQSAQESWLDFMPRELISAARRSSLGTVVLSRSLLERTPIETPPNFDLPIEHRWVLAEPARLVETARLCGALVLNPAIATCIERERVQVLRAALGDELYRKAVVSTDLRLKQIPPISDQAWSSADAMRAFVEQLGVTLLLATLPDTSALQARARLAFPRRHAESAVFRPTDEDKRVISTWLLSKLPGE